VGKEDSASNTGAVKSWHQACLQVKSAEPHQAGARGPWQASSWGAWGVGNSQVGLTSDSAIDTR
jgi:hypothetical protein